ncbi:hypothetical protein F4811DRAFT_555408 [Daldinia bambusicola]|nr:hypothetical protein F4811DRAFT_555408 [Daldinia bambusicola]
MHTLPLVLTLFTALFEAEVDLDLALSIDKTFGIDEHPTGLGLYYLVNQHDLRIPQEVLDHYETAEHQEALAKHAVEMRTKLDAGLGEKLMSYWRAKESEYNGKYRVIIVGALLMRTGAKILESDMQHLHELVSRVDWDHLILSEEECDRGPGEPGRVQFLAALDHYKPGEPRDFAELSCFYCGKIQADIGKALRTCGRCKRIPYCNRECQKADWKTHKSDCVTSEEKTRSLMEAFLARVAEITR